MKTRRNIYYGIGVFLILLNLLVDLVNLPEFFVETEAYSFNVGYLIGAHFLMVLGIVLLRIGYNLNNKIKLKESFDVEKSIEGIGTS